MSSISARSHLIPMLETRVSSTVLCCQKWLETILTNAAISLKVMKKRKVRGSFQTIIRTPLTFGEAAGLHCSLGVRPLIHLCADSSERRYILRHTAYYSGSSKRAMSHDGPNLVKIWKHCYTSTETEQTIFSALRYREHQPTTALITLSSQNYFS
jgi:hypothetical protein